MSAVPVPDTRRAISRAQWLRRDLRGLTALEVAHVAIGAVVLLVISVRAVLVAERQAEAITLALSTLLAYVYLILSVRIRAGRALLREDLLALELDEQRRRELSHDEPGPDGPYRSVRFEIETGDRKSAARWRRLALLLLVGWTVLLFASAAMVAHVLMGVSAGG